MPRRIDWDGLLREGFSVKAKIRDSPRVPFKGIPWTEARK
jgi:hypothetical protein